MIISLQDISNRENMFKKLFFRLIWFFLSHDSLRESLIGFFLSIYTFFGSLGNQQQTFGYLNNCLLFHHIFIKSSLGHTVFSNHILSHETILLITIEISSINFGAYQIMVIYGFYQVFELIIDCFYLEVIGCPLFMFGNIICKDIDKLHLRI